MQRDSLNSILEQIKYITVKTSRSQMTSRIYGKVPKLVSWFQQFTIVM